MPSWNDIQNQILTVESPHDQVRHEYLRKMAAKTGRNVIAYYSGWLEHQGAALASIQDDDKNGFMNAIYKMDKSKGLDLILHTPGGDVAATESIGNYLRAIFGTNIRCYVPQIAMSGGTMLACCGEYIVMGKESNLGPIDPQFGGIAAQGVVEEFEEAKQALRKDPSSWPIWQTIIGKYHPTFIGECRRAIQWSTDIATKWLETGMFRNVTPREKQKKTVDTIIKALNNHQDTRSHARHIHADEAESMGLIVNRLEDDDELQDIVLSVHHAYMSTFWSTPTIKIIESDNGHTIAIRLR